MGRDAACLAPDPQVAGRMRLDFEHVGLVPFLECYDLCSNGWQYYLGILDDGEITLKASRILYKNMLWQGFGIDGWLDHASQEELAAAQQQLWPMLAEYPDLLPVIGSFTLSQVQDAVRAVRTIKRPGKVLLMG